VFLSPRLAALAALCGAAMLALTGCTGSGSSTHPDASAGSSSTAPATGSASPTATHPTAQPTPTGPRRGSGTPVHVSLYQGDGQTYGVAMPIIAYLSAPITDASVFDRVTSVTVNGAPARGAWFFEQSSQRSFAMEAHYRLARYWPAHASIHLNLPVAGLWAGPGRVFDDNLSLTMHTGAAQVVTIDGKPGVDTMKAYSDGKLVRTLKVSLGAAQTPTYLGTAVVISKSNPQLMMSTPGEAYYRIEVPWSVRVTYDGEFLHDAYWNNQLGQVNLSHGCTNLSPADAQWYYGWSQIGDPVSWTNTGTSQVLPVWDGYGDWNLPFASYARGGLLGP
jgi:lipoprotein-anchoring transpeptidase ErfK/SrfK